MLSSIVVKNTLAQIISRAFFVVFSLLLIRIITENFGRDGYGVYGFVTALVLFFANFADWGTQIIAVREASATPAKKEKIFTTAFVVRLCLSLVAFTLLNGAVRVYAPWHEYVQFVTIASFVIFPLSIHSSIAILFQAVLRMDKVAFVAAVGVVAFFVFTILFLGSGLSGVFGAWVLGTGVAALLSFLMILGAGGFKFEIDRSALRKLVREALPMGMLLLVFSIYNRVDIIILEHFKGVGDVAIYNLAYKVHENLILGAAFLMATIFPVLSQAFKENRSVRDLYAKAMGLVGMAGLVVAFIFAIAAPLAVNLLTGSEAREFQGSILALRILLFATVVSYFNHLQGFALVAFGKQRSSLVIGILALFGNVVLNILLIPSYSYVASAGITVLTETFIFVVSGIVIWRAIRIGPNPLYFVKALTRLLHGKKLL